MYDITEQNKYGMKLRYLKNLEDAGEEFLYDEEVKKLIPNLNMSLNGDESRWQTFDNKIKAAINRWAKKIPEGKKSVTCTDEDLISILSEIWQWGKGLAYYEVPGITRSGSRFIRKATKPLREVPNNNDWYKLVDLAVEALGIHEIYVYPKMMSKCPSDSVVMVKSLKKIVRWKDMVVANKNLSSVNRYNPRDANPEQMAMIKKMWTNPELAR